MADARILFSIAPWFNNKSAALVLSYDDWSPGQQLAVHDLIEREMAATFFVTLKYADPAIFPVRGYESPYELMRHAIDHGIEIANHTINHPFLTELSDEDLRKEINGAKLELERLLVPYKCETFTYTYGLYNEAVKAVVREGHIAARITSLPENDLTYDFAEGDKDYFEIGTKEIHTTTGIEEVINVIDEVIKGKGLLSFMMHSIDGVEEGIPDQWYQPVALSQHRKLLDAVKKYDTNTWITTFASAVKYHKQRRNATLEVLSENKNQVVLKLSHTLDGRYNHPMSIMVNAGVKTVLQNGIQVAVTESLKGVYFHVLPNNGEILIELNSEVKSR